MSVSFANSTRPVYTSQTGIVSTESTIVEHAVSTTLRVNDAKYGLKTAAKIAHDKVGRHTFLTQKNAAINKQHESEAAKKQAKITALDADITKITMSILSGTSSDVVKAKALVAKLTAKRNLL